MARWATFCKDLGCKGFLGGFGPLKLSFFIFLRKNFTLDGLLRFEKASEALRDHFFDTMSNRITPKKWA